MRLAYYQGMLLWVARQGEMTAAAHSRASNTAKVIYSLFTAPFWYALCLSPPSSLTLQLAFLFIFIMSRLLLPGANHSIMTKHHAHITHMHTLELILRNLFFLLVFVFFFVSAWPLQKKIMMKDRKTTDVDLGQGVGRRKGKSGNGKDVSICFSSPPR